MVLDELEISDLNQESVHRYRTMFNNEKPSHIWSSLNDAEFLTKIGADRKSQLDGKIHPTLAGLIFFGDYITIVQTLPNYFLDYREKLSDITRWSDRVCSSDGDWSGNIFDFYFKIYNRLTADIQKPFALDENPLRIDDTSIHKSIRECLANSLIHADYYGRRGIVINKEYQKITFTNPGTFRINLEDAIAGGISDVRNASIFNMFSLIHVGERSGTGLCDVFHVWKESGFSKPSISETVNPEQITVELEIHLDKLKNDDNSGGNGGDSGGNGGNFGGNGGKKIHSAEYTADLSQLEKNILAVISKAPNISVPKLALEINTPKRTVERALQSLRNKSYIKREGSTRGKWIILK